MIGLLLILYSQLFIVNSGLKRLFSTTLAMARLKKGHINQYTVGTRQERGYMYGISSIYKNDCIADAAILAANAMNKSIVAEKRNNTEFELNDFE